MVQTSRLYQALTPELYRNRGLEMNRRNVALTYMLFALFVLLAFPVFAQDQAVNTFHFDQTVAVPGHLLSPGDYIFSTVDAANLPYTIKIVRADRNQFI